MSIDCKFAKIEKVYPHPNPDVDRLELVEILNYQVVTQKGQWKVNDIAFYVLPDATLPENESWCESYLNYLGRGRRVKTIKLKGEYSNGLIVPLHFLGYNDDSYNEHLLDLSPEECAQNLNIGHHITIDENGCKSNSLPFGIPKTDEENWQALSDELLGLHEIGLITRKIDGKSATYIATPSGELHVCSRRMELNLNVKNHFTEIINIHKEQFNKLLELSKSTNKIIGIRGEISGSGIQGMSVNKDKEGPLKFSLFGVIFPDEDNDSDRFGYYGSKNHFLEINKLLGFNTVPILGEILITKELLRQYTMKPASDGEGIVINVINGSYKVKSSEYYSKLK